MFKKIVILLSFVFTFFSLCSASHAKKTYNGAIGYKQIIPRSIYDTNYYQSLERIFIGPKSEFKIPSNENALKNIGHANKEFKIPTIQGGMENWKKLKYNYHEFYNDKGKLIKRISFNTKTYNISRVCIIEYDNQGRIVNAYKKSRSGRILIRVTLAYWTNGNLKMWNRFFSKQWTKNNFNRNGNYENNDWNKRSILYDLNSKKIKEVNHVSDDLHPIKLVYQWTGNKAKLIQYDYLKKQKQKRKWHLYPKAIDKVVTSGNGSILYHEDSTSHGIQVQAWFKYLDNYVEIKYKYLGKIRTSICWASSKKFK